ncbi:unnamed protein product [Penicillium olsonii]|nr:unnamed protein product [Penicillium olsonii]
MLRHSSSTDRISVLSPNAPVRPKNRISHTKSRNGCYTCKRRRVKCDEERPVCGACSIRGSQCTFPTPGSTKNRPRRSAPHDINETIHESTPEQYDHSAPRGGHESVISPLSFNLGPSGTSADENQSQSHLNMNDLNLLQHYILHTSKKTSLNPEKVLVWERIIPDMASTNEFLMHLLLALAGLDILNRESREFQNSRIQQNQFHTSESAKLKLVIEHHQLGLKGLQEELSSGSDAEILVTGSMLIVAFAFASLPFGNMGPPQTLSDNPYGDSHLTTGTQRPNTHWLRLVRGVAFIAQEHWMTVKVSRCRALMHFKNSHEDWKLCRSELDEFVPDGLGSKISKLASGARAAVSNLRSLLHSLELEANSEHPSPRGPVPTSLLREQEQAVAVFEEMHYLILYALRLQRVEPQPSSNLDVQKEIEEAAVTSWPHRVSQEFVSSLESCDNFATTGGVSFTILAHLYLTLAILEGTWYLGATFDAEIEKINTFISGLRDERLSAAMEWPISVIRKSD